MRATHEPPVHHRMRHFGMELQRIAGTMSECLDREGVAFRQQLAARGQLEPLAVPLVDVVGPISTDRTSRFGRPDRIVTNLGMTFGVRIDGGTKLTRHHLRTETNAEVRLVVAQWDADPVDLPTHEFFII